MSAIAVLFTVFSLCNMILPAMAEKENEKIA
jgi:hypothetical protein